MEHTRLCAVKDGNFETEEILELAVSLEELRHVAWEAAMNLESVMDDVLDAFTSKDGDYIRSNRAGHEIVMSVTAITLAAEILGEDWVVDGPRYDVLESVMGGY